MDDPNQTDSGPDVISTTATIGAPLFVCAMLLYRVVNGHWGSIAFVGVIFLIVFVVYVRLFWHDELDVADMPPDDAGLTSTEVDNPS